MKVLTGVAARVLYGVPMIVLYYIVKTIGTPRFKLKRTKDFAQIWNNQQSGMVSKVR